MTRSPTLPHPHGPYTRNPYGGSTIYGAGDAQRRGILIELAGGYAPLLDTALSGVEPAVWCEWVNRPTARCRGDEDGVWRGWQFVVDEYMIGAAVENMVIAATRPASIWRDFESGSLTDAEVEKDARDREIAARMGICDLVNHVRTPIFGDTLLQWGIVGEVAW